MRHHARRPIPSVWANSQKDPGVRCPVEKFDPVHRKISALTKAFNSTQTSAGKSSCATQITAAAEELKECGDRDVKNHNCVRCQTYAVLKGSVSTMLSL